ncbi:DUF6924 domain-containing protein [Sagittula salina]|uniref:DUF6924 domain-containing protein n=1 Tax=Sagittula salina TaxID=2820268 RepID=A0A940S1I7_9RHOB|nr:hypothetical protein [Sagittula salina]MBP0480979.1 hypothetical protein [Sagittula salina]
MADDTARLIRTDFDDDTSWEALVETALRGNDMGFAAVFDLVEDDTFDGADADTIIDAFPDDPVLYLADEHAMGDQSWEILVVEADTGAEFRVRAADVWMVENNLSTGNMDFEEMLEQVGEDGVFTPQEGI